jgi:hypothetical protein
MATQFYRTLDDIVKLKQENADRLDQRVSQINQSMVDESYDDELARLKSNMQQLGVNQESEQEQAAFDRSRRQEFIREHNIKHGSPRWFRVMYAQPKLTGEDPYGE